MTSVNNIQNMLSYCGGIYLMFVDILTLCCRSLLVAACEKKSILMFDPLNGKHIFTKNKAHDGCVNCVRYVCNIILHK